LQINNFQDLQEKNKVQTTQNVVFYNSINRIFYSNFRLNQKLSGSSNLPLSAEKMQPTLHVRGAGSVQFKRL
jgi:hypothetical protein